MRYKQKVNKQEFFVSTNLHTFSYQTIESLACLDFFTKREVPIFHRITTMTNEKQTSRELSKARFVL